MQILVALLIMLLFFVAFKQSFAKKIKVLVIAPKFYPSHYQFHKRLAEHKRLTGSQLGATSCKQFQQSYYYYK